MTTIVYRDGIMAADTRAFGFDKTPIGKKTKVFRLDDGRLMGVSTAAVGISNAVRDWVKAGMPQDALPVTRDRKEISFEALVVFPNGDCLIIDGNWLPSDPCHADFYAVGSGRDYALGALVTGCSAVEALKIAGKLDPWTGEDIETVTHK